MSTLVLTAAIFGVIIGVAVFSVNPRRPTNQAFGLFSLLFAVLWLLHFFAIEAGLGKLRGWASDPVPWIRTNAAINGFLPFVLWLLKASVVDRELPRSQLLKQSLPWLLLAVVLGFVCFSQQFIPDDSTPSFPKRGTGYFVRTTVLIGALLYLLYDTFSSTRLLKGIKGLEMRFISLNGCLITLTSVILVSASNHLHIPELRGPSIIITLIGYSIMGWAMTIHRVFNIQQIFNTLIQFSLTFFAIAFLLYGIRFSLDVFLKSDTGWFGWLLATLASAALAFPIHKNIQTWIGANDDRLLASTRQAVAAATNSSTDPQHIISEFTYILREVSRTTQATLITDSKDLQTAGNPFAESSRPGYQALCKLEWATPESVDRRRSFPELHDLKSILVQQNIGVVIAAPRGSSSPSLIVALGPKSNGWPYTFPEVRRLQDIADLMDNALTHSRLSAEAAVRNRINDITIISRGLAHDLKNLLTPISSFLVHTDGRFESGSPEAEVHAAAKRSIQLMKTYIEESQFVANRLEPRLAQIDLEKVIGFVRDAIMPIAASKDICLSFPNTGGITLNADSVLLQRLLINVLSNAIEASPAGGTVMLGILRASDKWLTIKVRDFGCGIPTEHIARVFDPGYTAKQPGNRQKGFGLGLTITEKIVRIHHGTIKVESKEGVGTMVSIDLPVVNYHAGADTEKSLPLAEPLVDHG